MTKSPQVLAPIADSNVMGTMRRLITKRIIRVMLNDIPSLYARRGLKKQLKRQKTHGPHPYNISAMAMGALIRLEIDDIIDREQFLNLLEFYEFYAEGNIVTVEEMIPLEKDECVEVLGNLIWIVGKSNFTPEETQEICVNLSQAFGFAAEE